MRDFGPKRETEDARREGDAPPGGGKNDSSDGPPDLSKESMPSRDDWAGEIEEAKKGNLEGPPDNDLSKESMPSRDDWASEIDAQQEQDRNKPES